MIQSNKEARELLGAEKFLDLYTDRFFMALDNGDVEGMQEQMELFKAIVGENDLMYFLLEDIYEDFMNNN